MTSRRLGRNAAWLSVGHGGRVASYLVLSVVLARALGPSQYGELSLFMALGAGLAYLSSAWPFLALPMLAPRGHSIAEMMRPALTLAFGGALVSAVVVMPAAALLLDASATVLLLLALYSAALIGLQALFSILQTQERMHLIALTQVADRSLAILAAMALVVILGLGLFGAFAAVALAPAVACSAGLIAVARKGQLAERGRLDRALGARDLAQVVGPLAIVTVGGYVIAWIDLLVLAAFRSNREVGHYALAYQIFTVTLQLGALWTVAALPYYSQQASAAVGAGTHKLLPEPLIRGAMSAWAAAVVIVAVSCAGLVTHVFGERYSASLGPTMVLLASASALAPYFAAVPVLIAARRHQALVVLTVTGVVVNVGLDLALCPWKGMWGAAVATAVQNLVVTVGITAAATDRRRAVAVLLGALPAMTVIGVLAVDPRNPGLLAAALAVAAALGYRGVAGLKQTLTSPRARVSQAHGS